MAHLLKAIQREHRKTGFGDSLMVHRRHSVLRSSKPKARRKYLVCAKGLRTRLDSMLDKIFSGRNSAEKQTTPSPASGMEHYMQGEHMATLKGKKKAEYRVTPQQVVAQQAKEEEEVCTYIRFSLDISALF